MLKQQLAARTHFNAATLPYSQEFLTWLPQQHAAGRNLVLCTAADQSIANAVAEHLGIFSEVLASNGKTNLSGKHKADALVARWGKAGFDYAGNSHADMAVWEQCDKAIVVNTTAVLSRKANSRFSVEIEFPSKFKLIPASIRLLRLKQWLKNILLFIPVFAAHKVGEIHAVTSLLVAFFAFGLSASTVYILNDLLDIESDRQHPRKKMRPLASGAVQIWVGITLAPLLLLAGMTLAWFVGKGFFGWLIFYFVLTCLYSTVLKRIVIVDCLTLAALYTLRVIAGAAAIGIGLSFWLLAFSVFLFLSLAFVKRYAELEVMLHRGKEKIHGRGYYTTDAPLIQSLGIASGFSSVIVLAFYLNSEAVLLLYKAPEFVWGAVPVVLFWISWMWMKAHRGEMHDDPLEFSFRDRASLMAGLIFAAVIYIGAKGLPF